jgi:hypothetical protein
MTIQYTNRRGQIYHLYQGITKNNKPKYFFSTKNDGNGMEAIPDGFEIYENPNAQVFLRKIETPLITDLEKQTVVAEIKKNPCVQHFIVEIKKDYITIYTAQSNPVFEQDSWRAQLRQLRNLQPSLIGLNYSAQMRFQLVHTENRDFMAERFCYRGSVDDWITVSDPECLSKLAKQFVQHLGKDSFYELYPV